MAKKSKSSLDGKIITIRRGVAIYKTLASPYWWARIRDPKANKYIVRTTKETSRVEARTAAEELASTLVSQKSPVPDDMTFKHYAIRFQQHANRMVEKGERNQNYIRTAYLFLDNKDWGLLKQFSTKDIRQIKTRSWIEYRDQIITKHPTLSSSTLKMLSATLRNVLKIARDDGLIDELPDTPRVRQKDTARPFFRFHPLVDKEDDAYRKLLVTATEMAKENTVIRGIQTTTELYRIIVFCTNSFVRPTTTELWDLLDGFLVALICGPVLVPPSEYLPEIWGDNIVLEKEFSEKPLLEDFLTLIMRHWNSIVDTLQSGEILLPLLLEDENSDSNANDWAKGFLREMELRREHCAPLVNDDHHGGYLIPILALAHEHDPDHKMRPYKEPIDAELRETLITGAASGVVEIFHHFRI